MLYNKLISNISETFVSCFERRTWLVIVLGSVSGKGLTIMFSHTTIGTIALQYASMMYRQGGQIRAIDIKE